MGIIRVLELFAGIGACSKALENLGIEHEIVDAVEIDKYAIKSFNAVHGTNFEPQDITKWDKDIKCDLIIHGSPCQDFSIAGLQAGGDAGTGTRSSLMYESLRIIEKLKPKYVIWENVKNLLSKKHRHNFDSYLQAMEQLGYDSHYQVLNAKNYGVPQNRERVFTVSIRNDLEDSFEFPTKQELTIKLKDILEPEVDEKYYLSDKALACFMSDGTGNYPRRERFLSNINRKNQNVGNAVTTRAGSRPTDNFVKEPDVIIYDDYNQTVRNDQSTIGTLTTNCGAAAPRNGWKIIESKTDIDTNNQASSEKTKTLKNQLCNKLVEENIVKGGEIVNHSYTNSNQRDTLEKYIESDNGIIPTMTTRPDTFGYVTPSPDVRIRKLTPTECWKLMGFTKEDCEKAIKAGISNSQLYKQAGNSIVVDVLMAILKELL